MCPQKKLGDKTPIFNFGDIFRHRIKILQYHPAYNVDIHSLCAPNLLDGGTYSKGERLLAKVSFNKNCGI